MYPAKIAGLFLVALLLTANFDLARAADTITTVGGSTFALGSFNDGLGVRIGLARSKETTDLTKSLHPVVAEVHGPMGDPIDLRNAFELCFDTLDGANDLLVQVKSGFALPPGPYSLQVDFEPLPSSDDKKSGQGPAADPAKTTPDSANKLSLTLTRAPAELDTPPTVVITVEYYFPWLCLGHSESNGLILSESGKAPVPGFAIHSLPDAPTTDYPRLPGGRLVFSPETAAIPQGKAVTVNVAPEGDFAFGKSTGKLFVRSAAFTSPVSVIYTMYVRLSIYWLIPWAIGGVFIGWLIRHFIHDKLELISAREATSELMGQLNAAAKQTLDATYRRAINGLRKKLRKEAALDTAADLTKAVSDISAGLKAANDDLVKRITDSDTKLQVIWDKLAVSRYDLPKPLTDRLLAARRACEALHELLDERDPNAADAGYKHLLSGPVLELVRAAGEWRKAAGVYLDRLNQNPPALSQVETTALRNKIDGWNSSYGAYSLVTSIAPDNTLDKALNDAGSAWYGVCEIADGLATNGTELVQTLHDRFPTITAAQLQPLLTVAATQATSLVSDLTEARPDLGQPFLRLHSQREIWLKTFAVLQPQGTSLQPVRDKILAGDWEGAINTAVPAGVSIQQVAPDGAGVSALSDALAAQESVGYSRHWLAMANVSRVGPAGRWIGTPTATLALTGSANEQLRLKNEAKWLSRLVSVIAGVLFIFVALEIYGPSWTGTFDQGLSVFAWAFFVDLTAAGLTPMLQKIDPVKF